MKQLRKLKFKNLFEILLVIAAILLIPLFFAMRSQAQPGADATPTDVVLWPSPSPVGAAAQSVASPTAIPPTTAARGQQPPACTFPLAQIKGAKSKPENYTFSEPEIVYTPAANDSNVEIVEWLPDNEHVLVVQNIKDVNQQTIELFNPETGERKIYAKRERTDQHPSWNEALKAVVYPVMHAFEMENNIPEFTRQAWVSYGDPQSTQMLADNLSQFYVAVKPGGKETVYLSDKQITKRNDLLQANTSVPFDLDQWNYRNMKSGIFPLMYEMAWRPGASQIFLYSFADRNPGYTFLLDVDTGKICELDLGGWAITARWSPNGRYLAISSSQATGSPVGPTVLTVLDTTIGTLYTSNVVPQELVGIRAVRGIAWAPDSRHLLVLGSALSFPQCAPNCYEDTRLYLVDFISGQVNPILPDHQFIANNAGTNLAWSPDGSKVIALCPARCSISVQRNGK